MFHYYCDIMPSIKKRLRPKTADRAKNPMYIRENRIRLNKVVQDKNTWDLVETKTRWFGRGDIIRVWDPKTRLRKKVTVADLEGNPVRKIEFDGEGKQGPHSFRRPRKRKKQQ